MTIEKFKSLIDDALSGISADTDAAEFLEVEIFPILVAYSLEWEEENDDDGHFSREETRRVPTGMAEFDDIIEMARNEDLPPGEFLEKLVSIVEGWN